MAIILVPQPGSTPSDLTDWEDSVETLKQYNLGVNNPVDYNFDGNTIKKGVLITIGGSNYYCNADTAITGTASDYVKITSAGVASYVSSLSGVSWNDTYNFYADTSGNAYIFNEAKAGLANTVIGAFAEHGYFTEMEVMGIASFETGAITMYQDLTIDTATPSLKLSDTASSSEFKLINNNGNFEISETGISRWFLIDGGSGRTVIGGGSDNGVDKLQVAGSASFSGAINIVMGTPVLTLYDTASSSEFKLINNNGNFEISETGISKWFLIDGGSGRTVIGGISDNGVDKLQVNGSILATTINTGQGAVECYAMDQAVLTTSSVTLAGLTINTATPSLKLSDTVSSSEWRIDNDGGNFEINETGISRWFLIDGGSGRTVIGGISDNGTDKLQVNGSASFTGAINPTSTTTIGAGATITAAGSASFTGGVTTDNVAIKHKLFTGTFTNIGQLVFAHGLTQTKILSVLVIVSNAFQLYDITIGGSSISSDPDGTQANASYRALITYQA